MKSILLDGDNKARGVQLENGQEIEARYVLSNATHHVTFKNLVSQACVCCMCVHHSVPQDALSDSFKREVAGICYRSPVTKINGLTITTLSSH